MYTVVKIKIFFSDNTGENKRRSKINLFPGCTEKNKESNKRKCIQIQGYWLKRQSSLTGLDRTRKCQIRSLIILLDIIFSRTLNLYGRKRNSPTQFFLLLRPPSRSFSSLFSFGIDRRKASDHHSSEFLLRAGLQKNKGRSRCSRKTGKGPLVVGGGKINRTKLKRAKRARGSRFIKDEKTRDWTTFFFSLRVRNCCCINNKKGSFGVVLEILKNKVETIFARNVELNFRGPLWGLLVKTLDNALLFFKFVCEFQIF